MIFCHGHNRILPSALHPCSISPDSKIPSQELSHDCGRVLCPDPPKLKNLVVRSQNPTLEMFFTPPKSLVKTRCMYLMHTLRKLSLHFPFPFSLNSLLGQVSRKTDSSSRVEHQMTPFLVCSSCSQCCCCVSCPLDPQKTCEGSCRHLLLQSLLSSMHVPFGSPLQGKNSTH